MCGHIQRVSDNPLVVALLASLGVQLDLPLRAGNFYPGTEIDGVLIKNSDSIESISATWWFLLDTETGKPLHRFATFNARHLDSKLWKSPIRHNRCAIIATGIGESIEREGEKKRSYLMQADEPLLLGGVYRAYKIGDDVRFGVSVITRDPHPRFSRYHNKAIPLFLPTDEEFVDEWLDPGVTDISRFGDVLEHPKIRNDFQVTEVQSTKKLSPLGKAEILTKDQ